ncbi:hypothetical protein EDD22DRAFT_788477 [Suillus occidentalis]|nr:hypothetical protein EDD22DRAFT_788477 [Suillus occidentalis]
MPRSKPTAKPNKLSDLAAKLSHLKNDINKLERTRAKPKRNVHYPGRHSQLIPKPKGQAGRSPPKGYQIQEAMGLARDRRLYNAFRVCFLMLTSLYATI